MKFTKRSNNHLTAHLYEHLFFIHLDTLLQAKGYFPIIDYSVDAYTDDGEITFEIDAYRDIHIHNFLSQAADELLSNNELLAIACTQLESESHHELLIANSDELIASLKEINTLLWNTDVKAEVNTRNIAKGEKIKIIELELIIDYPNVSQALKPLYRLVAGVTMNTFVSNIADTYGGFVASSAFETTADKSLLGRVHLCERVQVSEIQDLFNESVEDLTTKGGYSRLLTDLQNIDSMKLAPSNERAEADTGVSMDDTKWAEISNEQNLQISLNALKLQVAYEDISTNE